MKSVYVSLRDFAAGLLGWTSYFITSCLRRSASFYKTALSDRARFLQVKLIIHWLLSLSFRVEALVLVAGSPTDLVRLHIR